MRVFIVVVIWIAAIALHVINARADCVTHPISVLESRTTYVWKVPADCGKAIVEREPTPPAVKAPIPKVKPHTVQNAQIVQNVQNVQKAKRSAACGARRQVWRTLANGHRKYRCK